MRPEIEDARVKATNVLRASGLSEDGIAAWWRGLSSYLDDQSPADVILCDPDWVIGAAIDTVAEMQGNK